MFEKQTIAALLAATMLVLAGCAGGAGTTGTDATTTGDNGGNAADAGGSGSGAATMQFYISDRPGAIDQFEHLNVTVTKVGLKKAGDGGDDGNATEADDGEHEDGGDAEANATAEVDANATVNGTSVNASADVDAEADAGDGSDGSDGGWKTYDVNERTVDLTELRGANASRVGNFSVDGGEYEAVYIYVSDVQGTLTNGEQVNVKLPSQKIKVNKGFTVGPNSSTDFVFDVMVHEAGNSGKYVIRPVVKETGTGDQVEIKDVDHGKDDDHGKSDDHGKNADDHEKNADDNENGDSGSDDAETAALNATFAGDVQAGQTATLSVTRDGEPVENATVRVNGDLVVQTDADGTVSIDVPKTAKRLKVTVTKGDAETELEVEFDAAAGGNGKNDDSDERLLPLA